MIIIEDSLLQNAEANEQKLRMEKAMALYQNCTVSLRKAAKIAGVNWMELQAFLGDRGIYTYTEEMFLHDLETIKSLNQ